jgi:hypothetical protein
MVFVGNGALIFDLDVSNVAFGVLSPGFGGLGTTNPTSGKILVGNGTGDVLSPTDLHWDSENARLGVNSSSPNVNLTVIGDSYVSGSMVMDGSLAVGGFILAEGKITSASGVEVISQDGGLTGNGSNITSINASNVDSGTLLVSVGGTGRNTLDDNRLLVGAGSDPVVSADLYWDSANARLGVNTEAPTVALDVSGDGRISGSLGVDKDITVAGNLTINGTTTYLNTSEVAIEDNLILLNSNQDAGSAPSSLLKSGFEINRGTEANAFVVFDESDDQFKVGLDGNLQAVATRADAVVDKTVAVWDNNQQRYAYYTNFVFDRNSESLAVGTSTPTAKLTVSGNASISQDLAVGTTISATGAISTQDKLAVGTATANATLTVHGNAYVQDDLDLGGNLSVGGFIIADGSITGAEFKAGALSGNGRTLFSLNASNVDAGTLLVDFGGTGRNTLDDAKLLVGAGTGPVQSANLYWQTDALGVGAAPVADNALSVHGNVHITENLSVGGFIIADGSITGADFKAGALSGNGRTLFSLNASNVDAGTLLVDFGGTGRNTLDDAKLLVGAGTGPVQSANLYWQTDALGVGAAPVADNALSVHGNVHITENLSVGGFVIADGSITGADFKAGALSGNGRALFSLNASNVDAGILSVSHGGTGGSSLLANAILIGNGASPVIQSSGLTFDGGKLSVSEKIQVSGTATGVPTLGGSQGEKVIVEAGTASSYATSLGLSDVALWYGTDASKDHVWYVGNTPAMTLYANGDLFVSGDVVAFSSGSVPDGEVVLAANGSGLYALNASNIATGTLDPERLAISGVEANTYGGGANTVPIITVDVRGRVTAASTYQINTATTDQAGLVQLDDTVTSTSNTLAATANAVKTAFDLAASKVSKDGDTMTGDLGVRMEPTPGNALSVSGNVHITENLNVGGFILAGGKITSEAGVEVVNSDGGFTGNGASISGLNASNVTSGTLLVDFGGTGRNTLDDTKLLVGAGTGPVQSANLYWQTDALGVGAAPVADNALSVHGNVHITENLSVGGFILAGGKITSEAGVEVVNSDGGFSGNGASISGLNASNVTSGTLLVDFGGTGRNTLDDTKLLVGAGTGPVQSANLYWQTDALGVGATPVADNALSVHGNVHITENLSVGGFIIADGSITGAEFKAGALSGNGRTLFSLNASNVDAGILLVNHGGTGASSFTTNKLLIGDGSNPLQSASGLEWSSDQLSVTGNVSVSSDLIIAGNMFVQGTTMTVNTTELLIEDALITLNSNQDTGSPPPPNMQAGFSVDRGTSPNAQVIFEEATDLFKVGVVGNLQAIATRADNVTDKTVAVWDNDQQRYAYYTNFVFDRNSESLAVGTSTPTAKLTVSGNASISQDLSVGTTISATGAISTQDKLAVATATANATLTVHGNAYVQDDLNLGGNLSVGGFIIADGSITGAEFKAGALSGNGRTLFSLNASNVDAGTLLVDFGGTGRNTLDDTKLLVGAGTGPVQSANLYWQTDALGVGAAPVADNALSVHGNLHITENLSVGGFIIADGSITGADFKAGALSGNGRALFSLNASNVDAGTLLVDFGGTGRNTLDDTKLLVGAGTGPVQSANLYWQTDALGVGAAPVADNALSVHGNLHITENLSVGGFIIADGSITGADFKAGALSGNGRALFSLNASNVDAGTLLVDFGGTGRNTLDDTKLLVGAGTAAIESANLYWDSANSRLGINTATPGNTLTVNGDISFTGELYQNGNIWHDIWTRSDEKIFLESVSSNVIIGAGAEVETTAKLYVNGDIYSTADVITASDRNIKNNLTVIPDALSKIAKLSGYTYNRTDVDDTGRRFAGLVAQEVEEVLSEVVYTTGAGTKAVAYGNFVSLLTQGMKELLSEVEAMKRDIETLKA